MGVDISIIDDNSSPETIPTGIHLIRMFYWMSESPNTRPNLLSMR